MGFRVGLCFFKEIVFLNNFCHDGDRGAQVENTREPSDIARHIESRLDRTWSGNRFGFSKHPRPAQVEIGCASTGLEDTAKPSRHFPS